MAQSHKWTPADNRIAEVELQMAEILTEEINERRCVSLALVYESVKVRARVQPLLSALQKELGRPLMADTREYRNPDKTRSVIVEIKDR